MTTGANEDGFHLKNVSMERDIKVTSWFDLRTVTAGEPCAKCGKPLKIRRAIEVGHVFKLGTKYSEKLNSSYLDVDGQRKPTVMGCYGIGVTRTLAGHHRAEQRQGRRHLASERGALPGVHHAAGGDAGKRRRCSWRKNFTAELTAQGMEVILDDRDERPGVKFKDADLVGFPIRIALGEKSLAKGEVEIKPRDGAFQAVKIDEAVAEVLKRVRG